MPEEEQRICERISQVYQKQHVSPGKIMIIPEGKEVCDYTPGGFMKPEGTSGGELPVALISKHECPLKAYSLLGHEMFSKLKRMEELTGIKAESIRVSDIDIPAFFTKDDCQGLPAICRFVKKVSDIVVPNSFSDLEKLFGFDHGTDVWTNNAEVLLKNGHPLSDTVAFPEDIMLKLMDYGIDRKTVFEIAERVRKGVAERKGFTEEQMRALQEHDVPEWLIDPMSKIAYLFPKAHIDEELINVLRLVWYKVKEQGEF